MNRLPVWARWPGSWVTLLLLFAGVAAAQETPLAILVRTEGEAHIERGQPPRTLAPVLGLRLVAGDRVRIGAGGRAVLLHASGRTEVITRSATLAPVAAAAQSSLFSRAVVTLAQLADPGTRAPTRAGLVRGQTAPGVATPIRPANDVPTAGSAPTLVWTRVAEAPGYVVYVRGSREAPRQFVTGPDTLWTLPDSAALTPGETYTWSVGALPDGPEESRRFRVATESEQVALRRAQAEIGELGLDPGDGLFMTALLYREGGFFADVLATLDLLQARGEADGQPYHRLRGEAYEALGDPAAATREFALAAAPPVR